jgi:Flp pilus assembly protein TadD
MKLCPKCDKEFADNETACPDHGPGLVKAGVKNNPVLPGVRTVDDSAHTAMYSVEELEREHDRLDKDDQPTAELGEGGDAEAQPTDEQPVLREEYPEPEDRDATRALTPDQIDRMKAQRDARKAGLPDKTELLPEGPPLPERSRTLQTTQIRPPMPPAPRRSWVLPVVLAVLLLVALGGAGTAVYVAFLRKVSLEVVTVPPGATVVVDNVEVGAAPVTTKVLRGAHSVRARLEGYVESAEVVDVEDRPVSHVVTLKREGTVSSVALAPANDPIRQKADALHKEARTLLAQNKVDEAEARWQALAALVPDDGRPAEGMAEIARRRAKAARPGQKARSDDEEPEVARLKPALRRQTAERFLDQARTAYDLGDMPKARDLLSKCVQYDPSRVQCHRILARVYMRDDDVEKVKYHLQRYLELGGSDDDYKVRDWLKSH